MQFTAYITRDELEHQASTFDKPIAHIAQIFAADIVTVHCKTYVARCTASGVEADTTKTISRASPLRNFLLPPALSNSSRYIFHGYHPGILESYLLHSASVFQPIPHSFANGLPRSVFLDPVIVDRVIPRIHDGSQEKVPVPAALPSAIDSASPRPDISITTAILPRVKGKGKLKEEQTLIKGKGHIKQHVNLGTPLHSAPATPSGYKPIYPLLSKLDHCTSSPISCSDDSSITSDWPQAEPLESIFGPPLSPNTAIERLQFSAASLSSGPALAPIMIIGPATEVALVRAGLSDVVHTQLRILISIKRNTLWLSSLQEPPFTLSPHQLRVLFTRR